VASSPLWEDSRVVVWNLGCPRKIAFAVAFVLLVGAASSSSGCATHSLFRCLCAPEILLLWLTICIVNYSEIIAHNYQLSASFGLLNSKLGSFLRGVMNFVIKVDLVL